MRHFLPASGSIALCAAFPLAGALALGQIGGQTAADGDFVIDDFEELSLTSATLERDWLASVVVQAPADLELQGSGLTLASGQTPVGAMNIEFPDDFGVIAQGENSCFGDFGIPMPGTPGVSTDPDAGGDAGDITTFQSLRFLHRYELNGGQPDTGFAFNVLLECYPGNQDGSFPTLLWTFEPNEGSAFGASHINLAEPDAVLDNPDNVAVDDLLSQTRFLDFFFLATPVNAGARLHVSVDDITLLGESPTSVNGWLFYQ